MCLSTGWCRPHALGLWGLLQYERKISVLHFSVQVAQAFGNHPDCVSSATWTMSMCPCGARSC